MPTSPKSPPPNSTKQAPQRSPKEKPKSAQNLLKASAQAILRLTQTGGKVEKMGNKKESGEKAPARESHKPKESSKSQVVVLKSGLNALKSFQYSGTQAGIKYKNRHDMSLIYSPYPCVGAGVFTTNKVRAACVTHSQNLIAAKQPLRAIIANAGNANACTGVQGEEACKESAKTAATALGVESSSILLASTGVIGVQLPLERIQRGISLLAKTKSSKRASAKDAARGIMTTDLFEKEAAVEFLSTNGRRVRLAGIAKGSGMIHPNMATMLCFIITDCAITQKLLQKALRKDVRNSFNMISVDGDTSTNDMTLLLANARAGNTPITTEKDPDYKRFQEALSLLTTTLARKIARDGEGATKLLIAHCYNAKRKKDARKIAKAIVASSLVKAAMFGNDANWGRILCAMGYSGGSFDPSVVDVRLESRAGELLIMQNGEAQPIEEKYAKKLLQKEEVTISIDCKAGDKSARAFGCDLSYDYVRINADYRS